MLVELDSDPDVMRYITYGTPTPREATYEQLILPRWFALYAQERRCWVIGRPRLAWHGRLPRLVPPARRTASSPENRNSATGSCGAAWGQGSRNRGQPRHRSSTASSGSVPRTISARTLARQLLPRSA
ncbi:MAG: GNAT family N-acetyltransferase [Desulfobacterales bacterium]|nr:GNAT family N-acetyltransferase [Desulfobacterales bacterium]